MKKLLTILLMISLITCFTACNNNKTGESGENQSQSGNNTSQSGENTEQSGEQNIHSEGTVLSIEGNATTGYTWHVTAYDNTIIKVEEMGMEALSANQSAGNTGEQNGANQNNGGTTLSGEGAISGEVSENQETTQMVGTPSLFKFKITGLQAGSTDVVFDYYRSWEGSESAVDTRTYIVNVDNLLNVVATEKIEVEEDIPTEEDFTPSAEMETLVNDLIAKSGVQFRMPMTSRILLANAPSFVGLSEDLFSRYVVDSVVYEPMISPATSSMCIVKFSEDADINSLKQTVLQNSNPAKWICTGAEYCLVVESGRYIMLVMSTEEDCNALKDAFIEQFGSENVGTPLTKEGVSTEGEDFPEVL